MRYFIGNLIRGEAAEFSKMTCADLAARFGIADVGVITPPHLKIKTPFNYHNFDQIERLVSTCATAPAFPITLENWNNFGTRTIYIDLPNQSPELKAMLTGILDQFKTAHIPVAPLEYDLHLHLSIARFLTPETYKAVSEYLATKPVPRFDLNLDNLTIFGKEMTEKNWKVIKTFPLTGMR